MFKRFYSDPSYVKSYSTKGLVQTKNEDKTITINHPKNKMIKLLAVADGMGGGYLGKVSSSKCIKDLKKWFLKQELENFDNLTLLKENIMKEFNKINRSIYSLTKNTDSYSGTTLTCAIIGKKDTLILSIGDSRCYLVSNNKLEQVTNDDSYVWDWYKLGIITKEEARLSIYNHIIVEAIGLHDNEINPEIIIKKNAEYDKLFLFTDGVTDCLSDESIATMANSPNHKKILSKIIYKVNHMEQNELINKEENKQIIPGKDNTSAIIYVK